MSFVAIIINAMVLFISVFSKGEMDGEGNGINLLGNWDATSKYICFCRAKYEYL